MNHIKFLLLTVFTFSLTVTFSQECSTYFPFKEKVRLEYKHLDKKGKLMQTSVQEVTKVTSSADGLEAVINTELYDDKEKELAKGSYTVKCKDNTFYMDMSNMIPENIRQMGGESEMKMSGDGFVMDTDPKVGDQFPDSENTIEFKMGPMNMKMTMNISEHKVEAKETITTDAGTFECFRISYLVDTKAMMSKSESRVVNWYAKGVGTVKSASYNAKNDKLMSQMVLSRLEK